MKFFAVLFAVIFGTLAICLAEIITLPFVGVLVRFRANYSPKGLQLDAEGGAQPHAGPVVTSYFAMFKRVLQLEGWKGLYKGLMPSAISTFVVSAFLWAYIGTMVPRGTGRYSAPAGSPLEIFVYSVFITLLGLPVTILINRAITTPYYLPWFNVKYALGRLFTPTELRKPWLLYLTPGLLGAKVMHVGYIVLILRTFRSLLLPSVDKISSGDMERGSGMVIPPDFTPFRIITYLVIAGLSTVILCPLEVITTRLSLQRNHPSSTAFEAVPQEEQEPENQYAGSEDVIGLRNEFDPYVGFTDAAKRMVDEEGWRALYRGWWITMFAGLMSAFT
ncbi:mitochondrial carrier [Hysterangium stoloniferum]|nr:mitochondrial carrier [Hysterangium stoloniferum]